MHYTEIFQVVKNENFQQKNFDSFLIFSSKRIYNMLLTSTHNLCFGSKIRKLGISLQTQVVLYKSGVLHINGV